MNYINIFPIYDCSATSLYFNLAPRRANAFKIYEINAGALHSLVQV